MEVILLERVAKLGQMGDIVRVKDGFARNYLLRQGKALRATKENRSRFDKMKVELEARNLEQKKEAEKIARKLDGQSFTVLREAAEGGQLYGSVSPRDLAVLVTEAGFAASRAQAADTGVRVEPGGDFAAARSRSDDQRHRRAKRRRGATARSGRGPRGRWGENGGPRRSGCSGSGGVLRARGDRGAARP